MKAQKFFGTLVILALVFALLPAAAVSAGGEKVDVCHVDEYGVGHLINISENAFQTHLGHGDAAPLDWVPGQPGMKFAADCSMVAIEQKTLVQTLTVYPNNVVVSSVPLVAGQAYELEASGTFAYNSAGAWADAEWYSLNGVTVKGDTEGSRPYVLDISINGYTTNTDWGDYQPSHVYTMAISGTGSPLSFSIYDSAYGDNSRFLTVKIYQINWQ